MRLPFTGSELSVIRSGGRIAVQLLGLAALLLGFWALTLVLDRSVQRVEPTKEPTRLFPGETILTHRDGRSIEAILIARPTVDQVVVQRKSDGRTFVIDPKILQQESADLIEEFPVRDSPGSLQSLINGVQSPLETPGANFKFPHRCTLVSTGGAILPVTLLKRESDESVQIRRSSDGRVFTLELSRIIESDRQLIKQFPITPSVRGSG